MFFGGDWAVFLGEKREFCYFCDMKDDRLKDSEMQALLCSRIEQVSKRAMNAPCDFEWLSKKLDEMGEGVSVTTLKRCWGYVDVPMTPRLHTLDILSRYLGYHNYKHFVDASGGLDDGDVSSPVLGTTLSPAQDLMVNDRVMLTWQPGRVCVIRYLGNEQFVVERSERTRLQPGNTFCCGVMVEGEQLYLTNLIMEGRKPTGYVCGKLNGIHFKLL